MDENKVVHRGFTNEELHEAFNKVKDPENWKMPIGPVVIPKKDLEVTEAAIEFFCGSPTEIKEESVREKVKISAPGYYNCMGA